MIIKFCGIRREEDIRYVNETRPDLIGFVLDPARRRYIAPEKISGLKKDLVPGIKTVGVFVNEDIDKVAELLIGGIIDVAQLHGSEDEGYIRSLKEKTKAAVIKAFGIRSEEDIEAAERSPADRILVDSPGGGTGETFDWNLLKKLHRPYILAGGLNASNIGEVIERLDPYGVDVSSGIETDGYKDIEKMKAFMALAKKG